MDVSLEYLRRKPAPDEINAMPLTRYDGDVRVIRSGEELAEVLPGLNCPGILGFDTETRPSFAKGKKYPPSLIQLASADAVYLIQLEWLPFGKACADLLANPEVVKVGAGIGDDMRALASAYPFVPRNAVDLGEMAALNKFQSRGLRTLAASVFGWRISKGSQCSNWSLRDLAPKQIAYAATDAWISRMLYLRMLELGLNRPENSP
ncbi:MAG: 3'-5' exonuclease domain-containing protein 2 [Desulfovibrio sp.]|nr:3'-5' exonuclease domain-containing protein 2 [Desulfovibrio sp.]